MKKKQENSVLAPALSATDSYEILVKERNFFTSLSSSFV